jgi:gamma-glutamyltranspeptidase / glutathione hydrolase
LEQILEPAIAHARNGFPVAPLTAAAWASGVPQLHNSPNANELLIDGHPPRPGQLFKNANLADTYEALAKHGKAGFYSGRIAESIVSTLESLGYVVGYLHKSDTF